LKVADVIDRILERIANEPVMVTAAIIALGNLFGSDLSNVSEHITWVVTILIGLLVRGQVTPTRKLLPSGE
jgi:hypothetical protein